MTKYTNMFGTQNTPPARTAQTNLFGEAKSYRDPLKDDIMNWRNVTGCKTSANRIHFILNGMEAANVTADQLTQIGERQITEATEANKCVDQVVNDFAKLQEMISCHKSHVILAVGQIEEQNKPFTLLQKIKGIKRPDWAEVRTSVQDLIQMAEYWMARTVKLHLNPFLSGLEDARTILNKIAEDLENTMSAFDYVLARNKDPLIQDIARRRKEMFAKSMTLMRLNRGQLQTMALTCAKDKAFSEELTVTIKPIIESILRSAILAGGDEKAMMEIQSKLKAML